MIGKRCWIFCNFIFFVAFSGFGNVIVSENTRERIVFSWTLSNVDTVSFVKGEERYTSISFKYNNTFTQEDYPAYSFNVGVPFEGEIEINFTPLEVKTIKLTHPLFRNKHRKYEDSLPISFYNKWISYPSYFFFRSQRIANIVITPISYDEKSGVLTYVTKGSGVIKFPKSNYHQLISNKYNEFESTLRSLLINYDIAIGWREKNKLYKRKVTEPYPLSFDKKVFYFRIGDGYEGFNEATINENGLIRIEGRKIRELFGEIGIRKVKLYASLKGVLPIPITDKSMIPAGIKEIPLLRFDKNGNGWVDNDDYFLAYVTGASDWQQDTYYGDRKFEVDPYDDYRTYWITTSLDDGLTIEIRNKTESLPEREYDRFTEKINFQRSLLSTEEVGDREFIWKVLSNSQSHFEHKLSLAGIIVEDTGWLYVERGGKKEGDISITFGGEEICTSCNINNIYPITNWGDFKLEIDFKDESTKSSEKRVELKGFTVTYKRKLEIGEEPLVLSIFPELKDTGSVIAYNLSVNTNQKIYIMKIPPEEEAIVLIDSLSGKKGSIIRWIDTVKVNCRYVVCNESSIREISQLKEPFTESVRGSKFLIRDLRKNTNKTDYLIITHKDFLEAADSLASHKRDVGFSNPVVVLVDDIYRYFSGGDKDVTAIRNFIWYVATEWIDGDELNYVVLFGGGHFDAKNITTQVVDYIPVFIQGNNCIESFFTSIMPSSTSYMFRPQIAIGRIPCRTITQAWAVVDKIVQYEKLEIADLGEWRNRAVFVADDDMQKDKRDNVANARPHHVSSDVVVAIVDSLWPSMDLRKIYLYEYELDQLYQKPGAGRALINEINNGVAYVNFFGHGSEITWTDEYILTEGSITSMTNVKRYPFMSAFSCAVGRLDLPGKDCLSAALLLAKNAGAIGTLSSTREAYASSNEALAVRFYTALLEKSAEPRSVGMAFVEGVMRSLENQSSYSILGDPSIRPIKPTHRINITTNSGDTIKALQTLVIKGNILDLGENIDRSFTDNAYVAIGLFNPPYITGRKDGGIDDKVTYLLPGKPVFLGRTNIINGEFFQEVVIPQQVTFNSQGVKIIAYAWKEHQRVCGVGYKGGLVFSGSETGASLADTIGPQIFIRPAYDNEKLSGGEVCFTDRIVVQIPLSCEIELFDENGIDVVGTGPDEGINIEIEGIMPKQNFNHKFQLKKGDFRRGVVSLYLEEDAINPGTYTMNVSARDMLGNLSKRSFTVVVTSDDIIIDRVLNFPNPVRMGKETKFYCFTNFTMSQYFEAKLNFTIKIYTLSGKPIRVIRNARNGEVWDLRDQMGNILGPDVYLYQIIVEDNSRNSRRKSVKSKIMKLVILPPV